MASHSHQQFTPCPSTHSVCTINWCCCDIRRKMVRRCKVTSEPAAVSPTHVNTSSSHLQQVIHTGIPKFKFSQYHQKTTHTCNVFPRRILSIKQVNFLHKYSLHPDSLKNILPYFPSLLVQTFDDIKKCHLPQSMRMKWELKSQINITKRKHHTLLRKQDVK